MFNFKTKMTENKKTEKWSSLRLDLQQFTPQEFVAACWTVTFVCQSLGWIRNGTVTAQEHDAGDTTIFTMIYSTEPSFPQALSEWGRMTGTSTYNNANTSAASQHLGNKNHSTNGYSWKDDGDWHIITNTSTGYNVESNVSG